MTLFFLLCLFLAVFLIGSWYAYRRAFFNPYEDRDQKPSLPGAKYDPYRPVMRELYKNLTERPCEYVTIRSFDGLTLSGRYYHIKDGAPLDIGFHGYRSSPMTDFSGGASLSFDTKHNVLLVDQRAHGKSEGRTITFGIKERQDVLSWLDYALERFGTDTKIILYGVSMGAATVLMASELDLPDNVKAIIADCPYSTPKAIIQKVCGEMGLPPKLCWPFVVLGAKIYGGFDINEADAVRAVKKASIPILILHGEADGFVPCDMSCEVYNANTETIQRHTFPGADHGISFLVDTKRYRQIVTDFLAAVL